MELLQGQAMSFYLIHDLAKKTQLSTDTIRFYEKKQFIQPRFRAENHYRYYDDETLKRLIFIKHCRSLDISLAEIQNLLLLAAHPNENCHHVDVIIEQHIAKISQKINELQLLEKQLQALRDSCSPHERIQHCQILKNLEKKDL